MGHFFAEVFDGLTEYGGPEPLEAKRRLMRLRERHARQQFTCALAAEYLAADGTGASGFE